MRLNPPIGGSSEKMKTENDVLYHHHNNLPDPQTFTDNNIRLAEQEREASIRLRGLIGRFDKFLLWPLYVDPLKRVNSIHLKT